jgi:Leucine-rich repeat (LRR) protein
MVPIPLPACDKADSFIFVSYAHTDKDEVYPDIRQLQDSGYRIWYDEGITPSESWMLEIVKAINNCAFFVVFISLAAVESPFVSREIEWAIKRKKLYLVIFLVETTLPEELEFLLQSRQFLFKCRLSKDVYLSKFLNSLPLETKKLVPKPPNQATLATVVSSTVIQSALTSEAKLAAAQPTHASAIKAVPVLTKKPASVKSMYQNAELFQDEKEVLIAIEKLVGQAIPKVDSIEKTYDFGFTAENGHVTGLGLNGEKLTSLPDSIGQLRSLQHLYLHNNQLSSLPDTIGNLKLLKQLNLSSNTLTSLPNTIGNIDSLQTLILSRNNLTILPNLIGNLIVLQHLELANNMLSSLPETIGQLKKLETLVLHDNRLTTLPQTIGYLNALQNLVLFNNELTTLPETISALKKLTSLDLTSNKFSTIPAGITKMTCLKSLDLSLNQLTSLPSASNHKSVAS